MVSACNTEESVVDEVVVGPKRGGGLRMDGKDKDGGVGTGNGGTGLNK